MAQKKYALTISMVLMMVVSLLSVSNAQAKDWPDQFAFGGSFRLRHEIINQQNQQQEQRDRMAARLKMKAVVNPKVDVVMRLASGALDQPTSTNQTLGDSGNNKPFNLDLAYIDWRPCSRMDFTAGKMLLPFEKVGGNELLFDSDWTPEGASLKYMHHFDRADLFVSAGDIWLHENAQGPDTSLLGVQVVGQTNLSEVKVLAGLGRFQYANMKGQDTLGKADTAFGNSLDTSNKYLNNYELNEIFAQAQWLKRWPLTLYADFVNNVMVSRDKQGFVAGLKWGHLKNVGDWSVGYQYEKLEKDAVVGGLTNSDFAGGGTDGKGHRFKASYELAQGTSATLTYYDTKKSISSNELNDRRVQLDFGFKF